jgi:SAM-dependent methyltransferase
LHPRGPSGQVALDFGCAERPYEGLFRARFSEYLGVDLQGNPHADLVLTPAGAIPLGDGTVDCVLSSQVLEHVPEPPRYLAEARRVLRGEGSLLLSTHGYWMYHPDPHDYWRWTREGLLLEITRAGFEVVEAISIFGFPASALQLWQDATSGFIPRPLRSLYYGFIQMLIGAIERWRPEPASPNASVYVVLARRI